MRSSTRRGALLGAALITLAGTALRAWMLDRWLDYDEAFTYLRFASYTLPHAFSNYSFPNNHIFHTVLVWCSTHALGLSVTSLRLPALLAGCALIPLTFCLGRVLAGNAAGLIASALVAGSSLLAQYSVMARGYSVQAALFVASLLMVPRLVERPGWRPALALMVLLSLAMLTVPTLVYGAGSVFAWGLLLALRPPAERPRRLLWLSAAGAGSALLTAVLYAPAIAFMRSNRVTWGKPYAIDGASFYHDLYDYFAAYLPDFALLVLLGLIGAGAVYELTRLRRVPTVLPWLGVPLVALTIHLMVATRPPFPRTFIFLMPLLCALAGAAAQQLWSPWPRMARASSAACALVSALLLVWTAAPGHAEHLRLLQPMYPNTRWLFDQLVVPMQGRDELSLHSLQMRPLLVYAIIDHIPLTMMDMGFRLERAQRLTLDMRAAPSLMYLGQRFTVLAASESERDRLPLPRMVKARVRAGLLEWTAIRQLKAQSGPDPVLWELRLKPR